MSGRFRKVSVALWGDERVRKLTTSRPSGLVCWLYLLTARESRALPGAIPAGPAALSESLGWTRSAFLVRFREIEAHGMARADWSVGLVWLPNAMKHNRPESPNVAKAWAKAWGELPDCELKANIRREAQTFLDQVGEAFGKAFREGLGEDSIKAFIESEQEQSKSRGRESLPSPKGSGQPPSPKPRKKSRQQLIREHFEAARRQALGDAWLPDEDWSIAKGNTRLLRIVEDNVPDHLLEEAATRFFADQHKRSLDPPCPLWAFANDWPSYVSQAVKAAGGAP
jgi:hypothetical protein